MTVHTKQFDKANEPTRRRTPTQHHRAQHADVQAIAQHAVGNLAIQRLFQGNTHTKLSVSQPGDVHEQEAERIANQVATSSSPHALREKNTFPAISPQRYLQNLGPGQPLDQGVRPKAMVQI